MPWATGVVTADADGQHSAEDIVSVARQAQSSGARLVLGVRSFAGDVPRRSRLGNELTRRAFGRLTGVRLADTQTGLRAMARAELPQLLQLEGERYEYEMTVLAHLCRKYGRPLEVPIETIYFPSSQHAFPSSQHAFPNSQHAFPRQPARVPKQPAREQSNLALQAGARLDAHRLGAAAVGIRLRGVPPPRNPLMKTKELAVGYPIKQRLQRSYKQNNNNKGLRASSLVVPPARLLCAGPRPESRNFVPGLKPFGALAFCGRAKALPYLQSISPHF